MWKAEILSSRSDSEIMCYTYIHRVTKTYIKLITYYKYLLMVSHSINNYWTLNMYMNVFIKIPEEYVY